MNPLTGFTLGLALALAFVVAKHSDQLAEQRDQTQAVIACIQNTAYTRPLIRQCIADYERAGR